MSCSLCISQFQLRPAPPPPRATAGHLPALPFPGVGHLQILCCPVGGDLPTPGPLPIFWHARGFLSEYNYTEDFTGKESRLAHLSGQEKIGDGCKGMFLILCMHFFIACQARIHREIGSYRRESTFWGYSIKFLLTLFEKHPFIFIKLFITYNFTALY